MIWCFVMSCYSRKACARQSSAQSDGEPQDGSEYQGKKRFRRTYRRCKACRRGFQMERSSFDGQQFTIMKKLRAQPSAFSISLIYSKPKSSIWSKTFLNFSPISLRLYSTLGGTSAYTFLVISLSFSNWTKSRTLCVKLLKLSNSALYWRGFSFTIRRFLLTSKSQN